MQGDKHRFVHSKCLEMQLEKTGAFCARNFFLTITGMVEMLLQEEVARNLILE